jgi:L-malate glycosyltransferase
MKIVHVVDSMEVGGAETLVSQMCQLQRKQGHDVAVYAIAALGALGERMRAEGFRVQANIGRHLADSMLNLYHLFRESRPDVVHIHNPTPTIYASLPARLAGAATIISTRHSLVAPPHDRVAEFKYSVAARWCNWVVGICDATTENLRNLHTIPPRKLVRVYNGVTQLLQPASVKLPVKSGFTLLYVGRLEPIKNLSLLLNAFRSALCSLPGLKLWIVGDGSERAALENLSHELKITDHVMFWGQQLEVAAYFAAADAFIMSSKSEGLPLSLLQAMSLGLPVIVPDVGGMPEVVRLAHAGYVVPAADTNAMAEAIARLALNNAERDQFSKNGKANFFSRFSLEAMTSAYMGLYKDTPRQRRVSGANVSREL